VEEVLRTKEVEGRAVRGSHDNVQGRVRAQGKHGVGTEGSMAPAGVGVGSTRAGERNTQAEGDNMVQAGEDSKVLELVRDVVDNTRVGVQGRLEVDSRQERALGEVQGRVDSKQERAQDKVGNKLAVQAGGNARVQAGGNIRVQGRAYKWALGKMQDMVGRPAPGLVHGQALGVVLVPELGQGTQEAHKVGELEELACRMVEGDHKDSGSQSWFDAYQCASGICSWESRTAYQTWPGH